ncbi:MAG: PTS sugar transporter subunit IIA [Pseudomonadota bacterium]
MIGIVVVSHGNIGCEMVTAARRIFPDADHICGVAVNSNDPPESIRQQVADAIKNTDRGGGVLILTDMFGGTPSNICLSFLEPQKIEVVSGFNLPMLIKMASMKPDADLADTVTFIQQYGQRNIVIASHVLAGRLKKESA